MSYNDYTRPVSGSPGPPPGNGKSKRRAVVAVSAALAVVLFLAVGPAANHQPVISAASPSAVVPSVTTLPRVTAPPTQNQAQADASASAAAATFAPPTALSNGAVPSYSGSLTAFAIPADLSVSLPQIKTTGAAYQVLANDFQDFLNAWVEAWAAGNPPDPRYGAWCVAACHSTADPVVEQWAGGGITPAGTLTFYGVQGGEMKTDTNLAEIAVCMDASGLTAVTASGAAVADPFPGDAEPTLYVFGLLYDKAAGRWVVTSGYYHAGDAYCTGDGTDS
jgi:hypothetical protein